MTKTLALSDGMALPLDAATDTYGILAKKGAGKSNAAVVMAEEMHAAGVAWCAIDPKGDWWGVRSSADGKRAGLAVPVFGGKHGDVPLEATAGALMADLIIGDDSRGYLSCILDVSQFTISEQRRFLHAFGQQLYRAKDEDGVLHLFLEEAHEYLPQSVPRESTQLVSTWQRIVKLGRTKGLGITLVSQRSAALNKDVLTQVDDLIVLRTLSPQDRAVVKAWLEVHVGVTEVIKTLHELDNGEAWLWAPDRFHEPQRFQFRRRSTFDSGSTPKVGQRRRAPATLADVDLDAITQQMADTIEKAEADDPKRLHKRIRELEQTVKQLQERAPEPTVETIEVPVLDDDLVNHLTFLLDEVRSPLQQWGDTLTDVRNQVTAAAEVIRGRTTPAPRPSPTPPTSKPAPAPRPAPRASASGETNLGRAERAILSVLAQHPAGRTRVQLALLSGYSVKSSSLSNALGALRTAGYVTRGGEPIQATDAGIDAIDNDYEPLPTGRDLIDFWRSKLGKAERAILDVLLNAYPDELDREEVAARSGYSATSSSLSNALGRLRSLELVDGWRASDDLAGAL